MIYAVFMSNTQHACITVFLIVPQRTLLKYRKAISLNKNFQQQ